MPAIIRLTGRFAADHGVGLEVKPQAKDIEREEEHGQRDQTEDPNGETKAVKIGEAETTGTRAKNTVGVSKKSTSRSRRILWEAGRTAGPTLATTAPVSGESRVFASHISLIDVENLAREIELDADDPSAATSREHEDRLTFLRRYAHRLGGLSRRQLVADEITLQRLRALKADAPNAATVVEIAERAALLSWHAGSPYRMPPVLVVGPPGTGKTRIARRLAEAMGVTMTTIDGPMMTDRGPLTGHDPGYRGSGPGKVASALLEGPSASPLVLIDELDKVNGYNGTRPLDGLLSLLEPTTAACFVDSYVALPMRADGIVWVMTANSLGTLPTPLLDRVIVVDMPRLGRAETRDAIARLFADILVDHRLPAARLDDTALTLLESCGLREVRRIIGLALGPALAAGRGTPDAADIESAMALVDASEPRAEKVEGKAGALRGPVGFVVFPSDRDRNSGGAILPQAHAENAGAQPRKGKVAGNDRAPAGSKIVTSGRSRPPIRSAEAVGMSAGVSSEAR